ncbi:hypothetical protein pb186bvf_001720 [Paramecium bursaria]
MKIILYNIKNLEQQSLNVRVILQEGFKEQSQSISQVNSARQNFQKIQLNLYRKGQYYRPITQMNNYSQGWAIMYSQLDINNLGSPALANVLTDQQRKETNTRLQIIITFQLLRKMEIGTQKSNSTIISEFQIWDFPGYGIGEDSSKDIENQVEQIVTMNKASATHIILVFPYSQFSEDRGQNIIQLINLISQKNLPASIIVSKVPPKVKLQFFIDKFTAQLQQQDIIYTNEAKVYLNQTILNNRIQVFYQPQLIEEYQQFNKDKIIQLKQLVFNHKYFDNVKIQFKFLSSQEIKLKEYVSCTLAKINEINQTIINNTIKSNISRIKRDISDQQLHQDELEYKKLQSEKDKYLSCYKLFQTNQ